MDQKGAANIRSTLCRRKIMKRTLRYTVPEDYAGKRVEDILRSRLEMSGSVIKRLKRYPDGMLLNGRHIRTIDTVRCADELEINIYDEVSENIGAEKIPIEIMYEDEDILVINKPPYLPVHPSPGHYTGTLANGIMYHYAENGESHAFHAVNRLDKDTSGVMCVAKNGYAHSILGAEIKTHELRRKYLAIVCGAPRAEGTIDAPIKRGNGLERFAAADGQRAVTHYRVLEQFCGYALVELELETGRTHQIRVHMSHIGCPLLGDWLYGTEDKQLFPRQALHSSQLRLIHPITKKELLFSAPMAEDMSGFLKNLCR